MELALVDDPETLEVALALVDACAELSPAANVVEEQEVPLVAVASTESNSSFQGSGFNDGNAASFTVPSDHGARKKTAKQAKARTYNPNRAREEQRRELKLLRDKVEELESSLRELEAAKHAEEGLECRGSMLRASSSVERSVWAKVARQRLEERRQSERENNYLKEMLEAQIDWRRSCRGDRLTRHSALRPALRHVEPVGLGVAWQWTRARGDAELGPNARGRVRPFAYGGVSSKAVQTKAREAVGAALQSFAHSMEHVPPHILFQTMNHESTIVMLMVMEVHSSCIVANFQSSKRNAAASGILTFLSL